MTSIYARATAYNDLLCIPPASSRKRSSISWLIIRLEDIRFIERENRRIFAVAIAVVDLACRRILDANLGGPVGRVGVQSGAVAGLNPRYK
jgi:hypothetical protein